LPDCFDKVLLSSYMKIETIIPDKLKHIRLDKFLCLYNTCLTRNQAVLLIHEKQIFVNQEIKKPGYRLVPGDLVTGNISEYICSEPWNSARPIAEDIPTDIVFEDAHLLVINKRAGLVVHPAQGNLSGTLVNALLYHNPEMIELCEGKNRTGIVHRLDKDTSGLMVVAKTEQALNFLKKEFRERRVEKKYLALVSGIPTHEHGIIDLPIGRHPKKKIIMTVNHDTGKVAITQWKVKKRFKTDCLLEIALKTGRTHQIRVHFYSIGHPLIGETVYLPARLRKQKKFAPRQMLHASALSFIHPYSGVRVNFQSELPQDFLDTMAKLE
jgi:23S rRNA pseudouridine1911/1915/1917 synthase